RADMEDDRIDPARGTRPSSSAPPGASPGAIPYADIRYIVRLNWMARLAALAVMAVAVAALLGWIFGVEVLTSLLHPGRIAMNPLTAVCFLLAAAALWLLLPQPL